MNGTLPASVVLAFVGMGMMQGPGARYASRG